VAGLRVDDVLMLTLACVGQNVPENFNEIASHLPAFSTGPDYFCFTDITVDTWSVK